MKRKNGGAATTIAFLIVTFVFVCGILNRKFISDDENASPNIEIEKITTLDTKGTILNIINSNANDYNLFIENGKVLYEDKNNGNALTFYSGEESASYLLNTIVNKESYIVILTSNGNLYLNKYDTSLFPKKELTKVDVTGVIIDYESRKGYEPYLGIKINNTWINAKYVVENRELINIEV